MQGADKVAAKELRIPDRAKCRQMNRTMPFGMLQVVKCRGLVSFILLQPGAVTLTLRVTGSDRDTCAKQVAVETARAPAQWPY